MDVKHKKSNLPRVILCVFFPKSGIPKWILKKWPSHEKKMEQSETPDDQTCADDMFAIHNATLEQRPLVGNIVIVYFSIQGIILPSCVGILINHYKDPSSTTSIMESKGVFFSWLN